MKNKNLTQHIAWLLKEKYGGELTNKAKKDIEKIKAGEPVDYLIGFKYFLDCKIDLSKRPLIPRPETEFWTKLAINEIKKSKKNIKVLDIFSGSGCVGVAILRHCNNLLCDISEKDENLIKQIKKNLKINKINKKRYRVIKSDIFENIKNKYDFILANPPYISTKNKNKVLQSTLKFEPGMALFGGGDGLYYINKFLRQAKNYLLENGTIYMEFDSPQKSSIEKLLKKYKYSKWQFYKDQFGKERWVVIKYEHDFTYIINRSKIK